MRSFLSTAASALALAAAVADASTLTPPVLPLIVRNPYLSAWLGNARDEPWSKWPMFWTGEEIGFGVLASVPSTKTAYPLLGRPHDSLGRGGEGHGYNVSFPKYLGAKYDASTTNLTYAIASPHHNGKSVRVQLSFLSPVTPQSTLRQSLPAAYLTVSAEGEFDVDIYIDLNGQWVSGDRGSRVVWDFEHTQLDGHHSLKTWKVKRETEVLFTEIRDRAEWGTLYFTGPGDVTHESGTSAILRQRFAKKGLLQNQIDEHFRQIMDEEPVFAFSKTFKLAGNSSDTSKKHTSSDSALFTIGHIQDPVVQYASSRGLTLMRPLWKSWFLTDENVLKYHYLDFHNANALARNYSEQLAKDAYKSGSDSYVDIVALSARQVLGATSFSGTPENPIIFLKEISSNGNCQTVDVIFPAFPFFLYTNPRWLAYLLEPLLEHQLSGQYPNQYSMHDLGLHFPNQTGHADGRDEYMPVEECGDMLIMGLALVNSLKYDQGFASQSIWSTLGDDSEVPEDSESVWPLTNLGTYDGLSYMDDSWGGGARGIKQAEKWLKRSYRIWKQWTSYLVEFSLEPHNQLCTDDFAGWLPLQTNLALKGIIGIKAMAELASIAGSDADVKHYKNISEVYIEKWQEHGISRDGGHAKLAYDWYGSWTTLYSLFGDAILCFHPTITGNASVEQVGRYDPRGGAQQPLHPAPTTSSKDFIPHGVYVNQSNWYAVVMQRYGLPLDSRHLYTKSDWEFEAAAVAEPAVRKDILDRVSRWLNETSTDRPFTDLYETEGTGGFPGPHFMARPVVGGHFSFLALERACGGGNRLG